MTAKEWLKETGAIKRKIAICEEHFEELETLIQKVTARYDTTKLSGNHSGVNIEKYIDLKAYEEGVRDYLLVEYKKRKRIIDELPDAVYGNILTLRYIDGLKWKDVANRLNYDVRSATRLHGKAIAFLDDKLKVVLFCL
jgi:phosphoribosyl-ATP pyrophosphohydrolase